MTSSALPRARMAGIIIALGVSIAVILQQSFGRELLLAAVVGVVILIPVALRLYQRQFDLFEPIHLVAGIYLLYFVLGPVYRLTSGDLSQWGRTFTALYEPAFFAVLVAVLSMWAGYALPIGRHWGSRVLRPQPLGEAGRRTLRRVGWTLTCFAFGGIMLWARVAGVSPARFLLPGLITSTPAGGTGGTGTDIPYFFALIEWFVPGFLLLSAAGGFKRVWVQRMYWLMVVVVYISATFRFRLFIFFVATLTLSYLRRNKRPGPVVLLGSGAALVFAAGWIAIMRVYFYTFGSVGPSSISVGSVLKQSIADTWIFESLAAVMYTMPDFLGYIHFDPLAYVLVLPVPRILWPAKPYPYWLQYIPGSIGTPQVAGAGPAVPHFGEFYMAFGWVGIVCYMVVFGVLIRFLWEFLRADRHDPGRQVIFAIANIWLFEVIIRGYLAQIVKEFCLFILPAIVALTAARRSDRAAARQMA